MTNPVLEINHVRTSFKINDDYYAAVDDVSLTLNKNEVLAIVGESGCGKSALAFSIMGLHRQAKIEGNILFKEKDLANISNTAFNQLRGNQIGMIFQDPLTALNPLMKIGDQIGEVLLLHKTTMNKQARKQKVLELLYQVGITNTNRTYSQYPHELSGGMRQRVII